MCGLSTNCTAAKEFHGGGEGGKDKHVLFSTRREVTAPSWCISATAETQKYEILYTDFYRECIYTHAVYIKQSLFWKLWLCCYERGDRSAHG